MSDNSSHAQLGYLTERLFNWLLWVFQLPDAGLLIGFFILASAGIVIFAMWGKTTLKIRSLASSLKLIESKQNRHEFTSDFESIYQHFLKTRYLKRAWIEFDETLIQPPNNSNFTESRYQVVQNTHRPHQYFNPHVVPDLRVRPFMAPSTFVGIGLLLTFIGLVAALTAASTAFSDTSANSESIELAINNLLIVAGAKFFASIGGLGASILVSVFSKALQRKIDTKTHELCDALESRLWFVSQTQVSSDQYAHAIRQTARLEELKDQLAVSIGEQLSIAMQSLPEQFAGAVGGQIQPLAAAIGSMADNMGTQLVEAAGGVSNEARQANENAMNSVAETLNKVGERLEAATQGITSSGTALGEHVSTGALALKQEMKESAEMFSELISKANTTSNDLTSAASQINQASVTVAPMLESVRQTQRDSIDAGQAQQELFATLQEGLQKARHDMEENSAQTEALIKSLESLWSNQAEQLKLSDGQLESAFEQIEKMTLVSSQQLNEQLRQMDATLATITGHLNNSQSGLMEAVEALDDTVGKLPANRATR